MEKKSKRGFSFNNLSPKIKLQLMSLIDDFYCIEKNHTVVVLPFFSLLHTQGNESKPILNYVDINILDLMRRQFKNVIVYTGENKYLNSYGLSLSSVEHLANEQNILSRIVNNTTNFDKISDRHVDILKLYEKTISHFDLMKNQYELPYNTAFDIEKPYDLISFIIKLDKKIKQEDCKNKICLICPISYLTEYPSEIYCLLKKTIATVGGTLYFSQNQSDRYLDSIDYKFMFDEQYDEKFIHSIQDFANSYCEDILQLIKEEIKIDGIINKIQNGKYGSDEEEIICNIKKIDFEK